MPFYLYETASVQDGVAYKQLREIKLGGSSGPIAGCARVRTEGQPGGWHATERDLIEASKENPDGHAIVIDLKPREIGKVSLYRVTDVWGFSDEGWTPIALRLSALFIEEEHEDWEAFKRDFLDTKAEHQVVGEFLYLMGGYKGGTWNWGMVGRVNGALLWPDALQYLASNLLAANRSGKA